MAPTAGRNADRSGSLSIVCWVDRMPSSMIASHFSVANLTRQGKSLMIFSSTVR